MKKMWFTGTCIVVLAVALCGMPASRLLSGAAIGRTPEYVFTYAENQPADYPTTRAAEKFAQLVYERTDGRIKIRIHSDGALGDELSVIEQLQYGGIDFARVSVMTLGEVEEKLNILQLPYLYNSSEHMWNVLDGEIGEEFMDSLQGSGLVGLSWYDAGSRNFYTTDKEVSCLADLSGMRIRVAESCFMEEMVRALGAYPVPLAYSEVYSALETGIIDGAENNWPSYESMEHYKVAGYMLLDEHSRIPEMQLISEAAWSKLSEEDRKIIHECARESAEYERELWKEQESMSRQTAEISGCIVTELDEKEHRQFAMAMSNIYQEQNKTYAELIQRIRDAEP